MLQTYGVQTAGADCVVVGRSNIVGKPMASLMIQSGVDSTVTICHSRTRDLGTHTRRADILIVAAGRRYVDRTIARPGMAVPGGGLATAFAAAGWQWGGRWTASPDWQHFSATGG